MDFEVIVNLVVAHDAQVGERDGGEQVAVAVEGIGPRIDGFITQQGHELTSGPNPETIAHRHANVHISLRNIELPLGIEVDKVAIDVVDINGRFVSGGILAVVSQARRVDTGAAS